MEVPPPQSTGIALWLCLGILGMYSYIPKLLFCLFAFIDYIAPKIHVVALVVSHHLTRVGREPLKTQVPYLSASFGVIFVLVKPSVSAICNDSL